MKLNKKATKAATYIISAAVWILIILQIVFLTLKFAGAVSCSWWTTLIPTFCIIGLVPAIVVIAVIVALPKALIRDMQRRKIVEAHAKIHGIKRQPGESTEDLKKRIIKRNMLTGNYSKKDIKDLILENFPNVGSCQILVNNQTNMLVLILHSGVVEITRFSDDELYEIAEFAAQYAPAGYTIITRNAKEE